MKKKYFNIREEISIIFISLFFPYREFKNATTYKWVINFLYLFLAKIHLFFYILFLDIFNLKTLRSFFFILIVLSLIDIQVIVGN